MPANKIVNHYKFGKRSIISTMEVYLATMRLAQVKVGLIVGREENHVAFFVIASVTFRNTRTR